MGYRLPAKREHRHGVFLNDTANDSLVKIDNGTISYISIPCYSHEWHDRKMHDHLGWPSPGHPDQSCQLPPGCEFARVPINLEEEGYDSVQISMIDPPEGFSIEGSFDYGAVDLKITAMCESLVEEDAEFKFCVYAIGDFSSHFDEAAIPVRDVVMKGTMHIVAGPIS